VSVCLQGGDERFSVGVEKRGGSNLWFVSQVNTPDPKKYSLSRRNRITRESELRVIKRAGNRLKTEHLDARAAVSLLSYCRVAVIVGKCGHTVVERNRLRRRLRELARRHIISSSSGIDLMIKALPSAYDAVYADLYSEMDWIQSHLKSVTPDR